MENTGQILLRGGRALRGSLSNASEWIFTDHRKFRLFPVFILQRTLRINIAQLKNQGIEMNLNESKNTYAPFHLTNQCVLL